VIFEQQQESLSDHTGSADDADVPFFHSNSLAHYRPRDCKGVTQAERKTKI
jgi:hypothetical protein